MRTKGVYVLSGHIGPYDPAVCVLVAESLWHCLELLRCRGDLLGCRDRDLKRMKLNVSYTDGTIGIGKRRHFRLRGRPVPIPFSEESRIVYFESFTL